MPVVDAVGARLLHDVVVAENRERFGTAAFKPSAKVGDWEHSGKAGARGKRLEALAVALTRGGKAVLPTAEITLQTQVIVHVSATRPVRTRLRRSLGTNGGV